MKNIKLFKTLLVLIGVLIGSLTTNVWGDQSLFRVDMVYDFNGTEHTYAYYNSDNNNNPVLSLGNLTTGTFKIKKVYWHCADNWTPNSVDVYGKYNIGAGTTGFAEYKGASGDHSGDYEISNTAVNYTVATANTGNSGTFTFSHWWQAYFHYSGGYHEYTMSNSSKNYNFTFNILPPNATAITTTASGYTSGSGTEDDPYIVPVGGDLTISLSGSTKGRTDANSSVQYSVNGGSTWGTTSEFTSKTFSNVTATSVQNYVFKARCYNSTASLASPSVTTKTIYYVTAPWSIAGSMNSWSTTANPIAHYSSGTGYVDINLDANTEYTFKVKDRTQDSNDWWGYNTALTYSDNNSAKTFSTSGGNCSMTTAGAGSYRFTWNGSNTLTVTYPTSYTVIFGYGNHGSSVTASGSVSGSIESGKYVASGENITFTETHDTGYSLKGWYTTADGSTSAGVVNNVLSSISSNKTIYAQYNTVALTFKADAATNAWGTASNWNPACVPTSGHDVTIKKAVTISGAAVAKSIAFDGGSLTITSTGALEVAGTITNDDPEKIVVEHNGALIYSGSTSASVEMSMNSGWHLVALPVAGVSVSSAFAGKGVYTYAWDNTGKAWERRGYYDDLMGNEAILVMGSTGYTFSGALVSTGDGGGSLTYDGSKANGDVNMFGNSLTAPIKVSGMTITGSSDGSVHVFNGSGWTGLLSSEVIPAMQGYAILASSGGGSFSYSYATAVRGATDPNAALRAPKRTTSDRLDYITIFVSGNEWKNRICLSEDEQFTDEMDMGYEALYMEGEGIAGELYAMGSEKMNVLATNNLEGTVVGFIPGEATDYTISFEGDGKGYYLNDILMNQSTLIAEGNTYTFMPDESTNATRFVISRTPIAFVPTGINGEGTNGDKANVRKQMIDGILYIIRDGRIYNAIGSVIK